MIIKKLSERAADAIDKALPKHRAIGYHDITRALQHFVPGTSTRIAECIDGYLAIKAERDELVKQVERLEREANLARHQRMISRW
jgi:hypothetical protein